MKSWRTIKVLCCCRQGLICNVSSGTRVNRTAASGKCLWPFLLPLLLFVLRFVLLRVLLLQRVLVALLPPTAATYCCHLLLPPTAATGTVLHCFFFLPLTFPRLAFSVYSPSERGGMFSTLSVGKNYVLTGEWDGMLRVWPLYQKEPGSSTNADNGFVKYSKDRSGEKKRCVFLKVSL